MKTLADLVVPVPVARRILETDLQKTCVDWAKARGYWARKFSSMSQRSVPDFLFSKDKGPVILDCITDSHTHHYRIKLACEFKKPGTPKKWIAKYGVNVMSTEAQFEEQAAMRLAGWFVFECDNFEVFKSTIKAYEAEI